MKLKFLDSNFENKSGYINYYFNVLSNDIILILTIFLMSFLDTI